MTNLLTEQVAVQPHTEPTGRCDVDTVPFVELIPGRIQGVVSSGSDVERVYCAFIESGTSNYYSSTNNNRPDSGTAKRLGWLLEEAAARYGLEVIVRHLQPEGDPVKIKTADDLLRKVLVKGRPTKEESGKIFSRFLNYLRFVELTCAADPIPEMAWFVAGE